MSTKETREESEYSRHAAVSVGLQNRETVNCMGSVKFIIRVRSEPA